MIDKVPANLIEIVRAHVPCRHWITAGLYWTFLGKYTRSLLCSREHITGTHNWKSSSSQDNTNLSLQWFIDIYILFHCIYTSCTCYRQLSWDAIELFSFGNKQVKRIGFVALFLQPTLNHTSSRFILYHPHSWPTTMLVLGLPTSRIRFSS